MEGSFQGNEFIVGIEQLVRMGARVIGVILITI